MKHSIALKNKLTTAICNNTCDLPKKILKNKRHLLLKNKGYIQDDTIYINFKKL